MTVTFQMIDRLLFEEGIEGRPVAWLHDEIVIEVPARMVRKLLSS